MSRYDVQEALVGRHILSHTLADDGSEITFHMAEGDDVRLCAEGDCCSTCWIEGIDDTTVLRGEVLDVEDIDMPDLGNIDGSRFSGVDEVSYYGLKITTKHGRAVLDYRNSSNGYYGGSLYVSSVPSN